MTPLAYQQFQNYAAAHNKTNMEVIGEIISWSLAENTKIKFSDLVQALNVSGLETKVARALLPRYAFSRAALKMSEDRIIRRIAEVDGKLVFQFTKEYLDKSVDRYQYSFETTLILDKESGIISTEDPSEEAANLVQTATVLLAEATEERTTADVSRVIKKLFEQQADLFPVRSAGGVYFVPVAHEDFVSNIETFVGQLNGEITRFPVPSGTARGNKSVKQAVETGINEMIAAHREAVESIGRDTRPSTVTKAIERMEKTAFKIEAYAAYLEDAPERLKNELVHLRLLAKQKMAAVMDERNV